MKKLTAAHDCAAVILLKKENGHTETAHGRYRNRSAGNSALQTACAVLSCYSRKSSLLYRSGLNRAGLGGVRFSGSYRNRRQEASGDIGPLYLHIIMSESAAEAEAQYVHIGWIVFLNIF